MPVVNIDMSQFSGEAPGLEPDNGSAWFWPYRPYIEDSSLVSREVLKVKTEDGIAAPVLPETPLTEAVWVQLRAVKGAGTPWLVQIPATECNLFDLPHIDPDSLDPEVVPSPYWLNYMNTAIADAIDSILDGAPGAMDTLAELAAALGDDPNFATTIVTSLGEKVDQTTYATAIAAINTAVSEKADAAATTTALATKVNSATYTAGLALKADQTALEAEASARTAALATKTDLTSAGRTALALTDYSKLMPARVALANRMNARMDIAILGASVTEGAFVSTYSRTVAQNLATILRAQHPTPGLSGGGRGFIGIPSKELTTSAQYTPGMWPMAFQNGAYDPATAGAASTFDLGAKHMLWYTNNGGAGGNKVTVTLAAPVTSFAIHHVKGTSGGALTGYYKIDGGASVVFSTSAASAAANALQVASPATTSIEVGWNATGFLLLTGVREFAGDESGGIQVHNCGHSGMTIPEWQDGYAPAGSWLDDLALLTPKLLILQDLMVNDAYDGVSAATCQTNLTAFIAAIRTKIPAATCPIILGASYDPSGGGSLPTAWSSYVAAHKAVADADSSVVFVDHSARVPSTALTDTYGLYNTVDHVHPRAGGTLNMWMADTYASMLAGR